MNFNKNASQSQVTNCYHMYAQHILSHLVLGLCHLPGRKEGRKEGNVLFNDTLNTFYLRLYGVGHMVKDHSDTERKPAAATWATLSD